LYLGHLKLGYFDQRLLGFSLARWFLGRCGRCLALGGSSRVLLFFLNAFELLILLVLLVFA
jgi:hypothetical protein